VDDQVIKLKKNTEIDIELKHDLLRFLIAWWGEIFFIIILGFTRLLLI
jgi:hypothetical protein